MQTDSSYVTTPQRSGVYDLVARLSGTAEELEDLEPPWEVRQDWSLDRYRILRAAAHVKNARKGRLCTHLLEPDAIKLCWVRMNKPTHCHTAG